MRDLIELCENIENKEGSNVWVDTYKAPKGHYFKISEDFLSIEYVDGNNAETFIQNPLYNFFKERSFYNVMINANKCIHSKKKIHSVTGNSIILKHSSVEDKDVEFYITEHFNILKNNYKLDTVTDFKVNEFLKLIKDKEFLKYIPEDIKLKNDSKFLFYIDTPLSEYIKDYDLYLDEKLFLKNEHTIIENGIRYGVPSYNMSLDSKKIFLGKSDYSDVPFRFSFKDLILLNNVFKLQVKDLKKLLEKENPNFNIDMNDDFQINGYSTYYKLSKDKEIEFEEISILTSDYLTPYKSVLTGNRESLFKFFDSNISTNDKRFLLSKILRNKFDANDFAKEISSNKIANSFLINKEILKLYFLRNGDIDVFKIFEKILLHIYKDLVINSEFLNKAKIHLDNTLTILNYFNKEYVIMANSINEIWINLLESKKSKDIKIQSDEEFFFISGQVLYFLSNLSASSNKTGLLIQDVFDIKSMNFAKEKLISKYDKYKYNISINSNSFINIVYNELMSYKIEETEDILLKKNKKLFYYYQCGLIGRNVFFMKNEKESVEEIENE